MNLPKCMNFFADEISCIRLNLTGVSASDKFLNSNSLTSVLTIFSLEDFAEVGKLRFLQE